MRHRGCGGPSDHTTYTQFVTVPRDSRLGGAGVLACVSVFVSLRVAGGSFGCVSVDTDAEVFVGAASFFMREVVEDLLVGFGWWCRAE